MELYSRDLRAMTSAERKRAYREFEREFAASRPTLLGRIRRAVSSLRTRATTTVAGASRKI